MNKGEDGEWESYRGDFFNGRLIIGSFGVSPLLCILLRAIMQDEFLGWGWDRSSIDITMSTSLSIAAICLSLFL
jgi:hypothetical protein